MSLVDSANAATGDVEEALRALVESQFRLMAVVQQNSEIFAHAIDAMTATVSAPRHLITDGAGNPVGVMPQLSP